MKSLIRVILNLFRPDLADKFAEGIRAAAPYLDAAYEIARIAAQFTPTRADDEIFALAEYFDVPSVWRNRDKDPSEAIYEIVYEALSRKYPEAPERQLNRAIELAYGAVRP